MIASTLRLGWFFILLLYFQCLHSQPLFPIIKGGKVGYIDTLGNLVVPAQYDDGEDFNNGYVIVTEGGKQIALNSKGENVIGWKSSNVLNIDDQEFLYKEGTRWGLKKINQQIIAPIFLNVKYLNKSFFQGTMRGAYWALYHSSGKKFSDEVYEHFIAQGYLFIGQKGKLIDIYNKAGQKINALPIISYSKYTDSTYALTFEDRSGALISKQGEILFEGDFSSYTTIDAKVGMVKMRDNKYHLIDSKTFKPISDDGYAAFAPVYNTPYIKVQQGNLWGLIDDKGNKLFEPIYRYFYLIDTFVIFTSPFNANEAGIATLHNESISRKTYVRIELAQHPFIRVYASKYIGLINMNGVEVIPTKYKSITIFDDFIKADSMNVSDRYYYNKKGEIEYFEKFNKVQHLSIKKPQSVSSERRSNIFNAFRRWEETASGKFRYVNSLDSVIIPAVYDKVTEIIGTPYSVVGVYMKKINKFIMGNAGFETQIAHGLVNHNTGTVIFSPSYFWIDVDMLRQSNGQFTRAITLEHQYILIYPNGKTSASNYTYISSFENGVLKAYMGGKIQLSSVNLKSLNDPSPFTARHFSNELKLGLMQNDKSTISHGETKLLFSGGGWTLIDQNEKKLIDEVFEYIYNFEMGRAIAKKDGLWGVIDEQGRWVIQPKYWSISSLYSKDKIYFKLYMKNKKDIPQTENEETLYQNNEGVAIAQINQEYTFIRSDGTLITDSLYNQVSSFSNGYALVTKNNIRHILKETGEYSKNEVKVSNTRLGEGLITFRKPNSIYWGVMNVDSQLLINPRFERLGKFNKGLCPASIDLKKYGYINSSGDWVIKPQFSYAGNFTNEGIAQVTKGSEFNEKRFYINMKGKRQTFAELKNQREDQVHIQFKDRGQHKIYRVVNKHLATKFKRPSLFHEHINQMYPYQCNRSRIIYKNRHRIGFIDTTGRILSKKDWIEASDFSAEGIAVINKKKIIKSQNRKRDSTIIVSYAIDTLGTETEFKVRLSPISPSEGRFIGPVKVAKFETRYTIYNLNGERLSDSNYIKIEPYQYGVARVQGQNRLWGVVNKQGDLILPLIFNKIKPFESLDYLDINLSLGLSDINGNEILPPVYDKIISYTNGIIRLENKGARGYLTENANWIWPMQK
jgi:hypothetical protein